MQINIMILNYYADDEAWSYDELGPREFRNPSTGRQLRDLEEKQWDPNLSSCDAWRSTPIVGQLKETRLQKRLNQNNVGVIVGGETGIMNEQARQESSEVNVKTLGVCPQIRIGGNYAAVVNGESDADI